MPSRKMRVEVFDGEGNKYTVSFEGQISREKALRLLDLVELLGGVSNERGGTEAGQSVPSDDITKYGKTRILLVKHFPLVWFSSREVQTVYEKELKEPISLSTVATYLSRMTAKGVLVKTGSSQNLKYRLVTNLPQPAIRQQIPGQS
jgi:hypothetical protein